MITFKVGIFISGAFFYQRKRWAIIAIKRLIFLKNHYFHEFRANCEIRNFVSKG
jgi:hypothetical protein